MKSPRNLSERFIARESDRDRFALFQTQTNTRHNNPRSSTKQPLWLLDCNDRWTPLFGIGVVRYEQMFGFMDEIKLGREALDAQTAAWLEQVAAFDRSEQWRAAGYYS